MSTYNVATQIAFFSNEMIIKEVISASHNPRKNYFLLAGKTIGHFSQGKKCKLEDWGNRYTLTDENGEWIEFTA